MFGKYKVVHLVGIAREHREQFQSAEEYLTKQGYIVF